MLQTESDQKSVDIEQLQSDFCAEVDELNQVIEAQRVMLATAQDRINELMQQNTRLLARGGGEWVPVAAGTYFTYYEGYVASFVVADGGASVQAKSGNTGIDLNFENYRICRKV